MINGTVSDLDKLVLMAEDVSKTVSALQTKIAHQRAMFVIFIAAALSLLPFLLYLFYMKIQMGQSNFANLIPRETIVFIRILGAVIGVFGIYYAYNNITKMRIYRRELNSETEILRRLLDMVHEYRQYIHDKELSYVENAIFEMRIQRIKFSTKQSA